MSPTDLAWAAGFIDGEGYVTVYKKNPIWRTPKGPRTGRPRLEGTTFYIQVVVVNRNPAPIDKLVELFGGTRYVRDRSGSYKNDYFHWRICGAPALAALELIIPFLVGKRELAETCISFEHWYRATRPKPGEAMPPERRAQAEMYHQQCRALIRRYRQAYVSERPAVVPIAQPGSGT